MIVSTAYEQELLEFKKLMRKMDNALNQDAKTRENYYVTRGGKKIGRRCLCGFV